MCVRFGNRSLGNVLIVQLQVQLPSFDFVGGLVNGYVVYECQIVMTDVSQCHCRRSVCAKLYVSVGDRRDQTPAIYSLLRSA